MHRPVILGRLVKWSIELSEFDIEYQPHKAIKAQALADFIVKRFAAEGIMVRQVKLMTIHEDENMENKIAHVQENAMLLVDDNV